LFFAKISPVLDDFESSHNLLIEKYPHDGPAWSFKFKHPVDGVGQIEVEKSGEDTILVRWSWWIDDYDTSTRFLKYPPPKKVGMEHGEVRNALEKALEEILRWKKDELAPYKAPYPWSKRCSKEQFLKSYERFPELKK
jgi:hypothetical protein